MEIFCETCKAKFKIPDEKLPKDKLLNIPCPKCKGSISVDTRVLSEEPSEETAIDFHEEGEKTALICDDKQSNLEILITSLKDLGYIPSVAKNVKDVLEKMKFTHYNLIVLNEEFGGGTPSDNPVLSHIQLMPIVTRRNVFFALIGKEYTTFNNMMAFSKSANLVINQKDLPQIKNILRKSIYDNDKFYKVFKETFKTLGKG
ncbi:MAG: zinc-ribbon domain-containing protein [Pseudomonadota bacterium]